MFDLEPSDQCEYDFLEIRDGPFGKQSKICVFIYCILLKIVRLFPSYRSFL